MKVLATQLALAAVLALASFSTLWSASPATAIATSEYESTGRDIKIWNEPYGDDDDECLLEVQGLLDPVLKSMSRESPVGRIRAVLEERYGADVVETLLAPHYVVVWVDGSWLLVCLGASSFEIDFDERGEVYVEIEERLPMY